LLVETKTINGFGIHHSTGVMAITLWLDGIQQVETAGRIKAKGEAEGMEMVVTIGHHDETI
jgi:hypothetical protein